MEWYLQFAVTASWLVNWFLLFAKLYITIVSSSKSVAAALVDSVVDLLSQGVLSLAESQITRHSPDYPVGRSRLQALSVIATACIMSIASIEVIQFAAQDIYDGFKFHHLPVLDVTISLYVILGVGIVLKVLLWIYCLAANKTIRSDTIGALAEDHLNDVMSNSVAIITVAIAVKTSRWYMDPIGAIIISLIIIYRWMEIIRDQVRKIVGYIAPPEFISQVESATTTHDSRIELDCTRIYHFGTRFNVEIEIILPPDMTVRESHDIALALQHKIEEMDDVERCFVHVDYAKRNGLEHRVERELVLSSSSTRARNSVFAKIRHRFSNFTRGVSPSSA